MKFINRVVDFAVEFVAGFSAISVLVVTFAQVVSRYVLKSPLPWSTDILRLAFTYLVFWGAAWCVKTQGHLCVDVVLEAVPSCLRRVLELLIDLASLTFFIFMIVYGWEFSKTGLTQTTSYLPIPMAVYYISLPSAGAIMAFYIVQIIISRICGIFTGRPAGGEGAAA